MISSQDHPGENLIDTWVVSYNLQITMANTGSEQPTMMAEEQIFVRNPDYIFRKIVDEVVLVPIHQDVVDMKYIYTLNDVGAFVWQSLEAPTSFRSLVTALANKYDVDYETIVEDLGTFLRELEACGAVLKEAN